MLSARTIYGEIFDNDEAFGLFCSIAASGEAQGGCAACFRSTPGRRSTAGWSSRCPGGARQLRGAVRC